MRDENNLPDKLTFATRVGSSKIENMLFCGKFKKSKKKSRKQVGNPNRKILILFILNLFFNKFILPTFTACYLHISAFLNAYFMHIMHIMAFFIA